MKRALSLGIVLGVVAGVLVGFAAPASAAELPWPLTLGGDDYGAICNMDMSDGDGGDVTFTATVGFTLRFACQGKSSTGTTVQGFNIYLRDTTNRRSYEFECGVNGGGGFTDWSEPSGTCVSNSWVVGTDNAWQARFTMNVSPAASFTCSTTPANQPAIDGRPRSTCNTFGTDAWDLQTTEGGPGGGFYCSPTHGGVACMPGHTASLVYYDVITQAGSAPAMPDDYFAGGSTEAANIQPPGWDCGRTMNDAGGSRYFTTLKALGPSNTAPGVEDYDFAWHAEWDGWTVHPGTEIELLTPPAGEAPPGGWIAVFTAKRRLTPTPGYQSAPAESIPWVVDNFSTWVDPDERPWYVNPYYEEFGRGIEDVLGGVEDFVRDPLGGLHGFLFRDWPDAEAPEGDPLDFGPVGGGDWVAPNRWASVEVSCAVLVDPSNPSDTAPGASVGVGDSPDEGSPASPPGEGSAECEMPGGVIDKLNPLEWLGFATCSGIKALGNVIAWLFVPPANLFDGMLDGIEDGFPFNVVTELVDAVTLFQESAENEGGYGSACGPLVDPGSAVEDFMPVGAELDAGRMRFPTPSDSGCDGMAAQGTRTDIDDKVGDVWGLRVFFRSLATLALWVMVFFAIVRAFGGSDGDLEANPFDQVAG